MEVVSVVGEAGAALEAGATVTICVDWRVEKRVCVSVAGRAELTGADAGTEAGTDGTGAGELAGTEGAGAEALAGGTEMATLEVAEIAAALGSEVTDAGTGITVTETGMMVVEVRAGQLVTVAAHSVTVISCVLKTVDVT